MTSPVQKLRDVEAEWMAKATQSAIDGAREATESINPRAAISSLSNLEWTWIAMGAVFNWIKVKSQQAVADGVGYERAIRYMPQYFMQPWEAGVVESILPRLGDVKGIPWEKPLNDWTKAEIVRLVWNAHSMIESGIKDRDNGAEDKITQPSRSRSITEREASARAGGPLWDRQEYTNDDDVPF